MSTLTTMAPSASFVVLEDHPLYREGLVNYLNKEFPQSQIAYEGADFLEVKNIWKRPNPILRSSICILEMEDPRVRLLPCSQQIESLFW